MDNTNETTEVNKTNETQDTVKTTETNETAKTADKNGEKQENNDQKAGLADQITKIRTKMQKRIDSEASSKNEYKQQLAESQKQIETLTQKLSSLNPKGDQSKQEKEVDPNLKKALDENKSLKAQIARSGQIRTVASQFSQAGVNVPEGILKLVVPKDADDKAISNNMQALSKFYDAVVSGVRKSFMSAQTPRVGSDVKPFSSADLAKITDPVKRLQAIKEHLKNN